MVEIIRNEYEGYSQSEAQGVHEDIAEAIECLYNMISVEVGDTFAGWIEKTLLVAAEGTNAENLRDIYEALQRHKFGHRI